MAKDQRNVEAITPMEEDFSQDTCIGILCKADAHDFIETAESEFVSSS